MSKLIVVLFVLVTFFGKSQNTNVPDPIFEQYLITHGFDTGSIDGVVPSSNLSTVYVLQVQNLGLNSLQGIEDMTNLVFLDCSNNNITTLDLSNNLHLLNLLCSQNQISSLLVGQNSTLAGIYAAYNQLSNIDVSFCPSLSSLEFRYNNISSINLENLSLLEFLGISKNNLSTIDVSKNPIIKRLDCSKNNISTLNVASNFMLDSLVCDSNNLTNLNLSNLNNLHVLICDNNQIDGTLDVSDNELLKSISCSKNSIDIVNIENCPALQRIFVSDNQLTSFDISSCPQAFFVSFCNNNFQFLNLKNGNNTNFYNNPCLWGNPLLTCVLVDDPQYSNSNWIKPNTVTYNTNCNSSVETINACNSYQWMNGTMYNASTNSPIYVIQNGAMNGLDSTIYLNLNIVNNNTSVTQTGSTLTANQTEVAYQWLDCNDNNALVNGANLQSFSPNISGSYAVIIENGSCIDTSSCFSLLALKEIEGFSKNYCTIYPNPSNGNFNIQLNTENKETITISIYTILGENVHNQTIKMKEPGENNFEINLNDFMNNGIYLVQIKNESQTKSIQKLIIKK